MATRTRRAATPAPAPEPEPVAEETGGQKRGPGALQDAHVAWIKANYDVDIDPEHLYLAQTTRAAFRSSEAYESFLAAEEDRKAEAEVAKEKRRADREATRKLAEETPVAEEPAKPVTRSRRKAPAGAEAASVAEPEVKPATRSRSRKAATTPAAEEPVAETTTTPARRTRKAPF